MKAEPLDELTEAGLAELSARMQAHLTSGAGTRFPNSLFRWSTEEDVAEPATIDWIAFPERVATCLGRSASLALLDIEDVAVGDGGRRLQEEYAEWRVVSSDRGIERIDVTTETSHYWCVLATHAPQTVLDLIAEFAGESRADASLVYGVLDPFAAETSPQMRAEAFAQTMLASGTSPYNNGARAITCMVHVSNSITALLELAVAATNALAVTSDSGVTRCPTCIELTSLLGNAAQMGRASDPLIIERLARLAFEGRGVGLDTPGPLAISGIESGRLRTPLGEPVPTEWFSLSRPMRSGDRYQRVAFAVPDDEGYCISDLIDVATEERLTDGGQIADLIQVSLYLRTTAPTAHTRADLEVVSAPDIERCGDVQEIARELGRRLP